MSKQSIILIEDESAIADTVSFALEQENLIVRHHTLGNEGLKDFFNSGADLIILDVGLPDINGLDICRKIRSKSEVPVIFLTARNSETDLVVGLELGGDDYMTKPFSPRELVARVRAMLRRSKTAAGSPEHPENDCPQHSLFNIDTDSSNISYNGISLSLTRQEYLILETLLSQPGRIFSRSQIMERAWESPETSLERAVDTHIKSLRAKLKQIVPDFDPIITKRGFGYSILADQP